MPKNPAPATLADDSTPRARLEHECQIVIALLLKLDTLHAQRAGAQSVVVELETKIANAAAALCDALAAEQSLALMVGK